MRTLLELREGRLGQVRVGEAASPALAAQVLQAVRAQLIEVLDRPLLEIEWRQEADSWWLTAMEASGAVVSVLVSPSLDGAGLVAAMARQAELARLTRTELAQRYPAGAQALAEHWGELRAALPASVGRGAALTVLTEHLGDGVREAVPFLDGSGVEVYTLDVRELPGEHGTHTIVTAQRVGRGTWSLPVPVLVDSGRRRGAASLSAHRGAEGGPQGAGRAQAPDSRRARRARERAGQGEQPVVDSAPTAQIPHVVASHRSADQPLGASLTVAVGPQSAQALASAAADLREPVALVWASARRGFRYEATLLPGGRLVLADGRVFTDPSVAASAARGDSSVGDVDGWRVWRLGEGGAHLASLLPA